MDVRSIQVQLRSGIQGKTGQLSLAGEIDSIISSSHACFSQEVNWSTDFRPSHFPNRLGGLDATESRGKQWPL